MEKEKSSKSFFKKISDIVTNLNENDNEENSANDDSDIVDEDICFNEYEENFWPDAPEEPVGFSYKGKKRNFLNAVESLKLLFKKGARKVVASNSFAVLDARKISHGMEYDVEVTKSKDRGQVNIKIYGPSTKKGHSIIISKSKKHEPLYVKMFAVEVIKQ